VLIKILLAIILGSLGAGAGGAFLRFSREGRRARRRIVFLCGYLVTGGAAVITLYVLVWSLQRSNGRRTLQDEISLWVYIASYLSILVLSVRGELRWRRAVGLTKVKDSNDVHPS
jgi:hypothetical protein